MSDPTPSTPPAPSSLLSDIIKASSEKTVSTPPWEALWWPSSPPPIRPPREPISLATFVRLIGSLLLVAIIFFGSFLAYIAFHPEQAVFFVNTFGIDPEDIKNLLVRLINGTFGCILVVLSIVWVISLFRAVWVPKDLKRKRLLSWLWAGVLGIIFFSVLTFWIYLFRVVNASEYDNPNGAIILYDQAQYVHERFRDQSKLSNTQNLIGPIDIFFDIRSNAKLLTDRNLYTIEQYEIEFNGARCANDIDTIRGSDPSREQSLVCTFDQIRPYDIVGSYTVRDRTGKVSRIPIVLPSIEIRWLVDIKNQTNSRGQKIVTLDATWLKKLWTPEWIYENTNKTVTESSITEIISDTPERICLKVFQKDGCDRVLVLQDTESRDVKWSISSIQDRTDGRVFQFSLSGMTINPNEIVSIEWLLDNQTVICNRGDEVCNYTFSQFWKSDIAVIISLASGKRHTFNTTVTVNQPINLIRHVKVYNEAGTLLNEENTFDQSLRSFVLKNTIIPPEILTFDARDVVPEDPGYNIDTVLWKIDNGKEVSFERGTKVVIPFNQPLRYTIDADITFRKTTPGAKDLEDHIVERIIIDIERKSLMPRLEVSKTSDYVPSLVTVDASQSEAENGEIKKFIFDFGEGRTSAEGDAIQEYSYTTAGDKTITLTIIGENGDRASLKKTIVLKDEIRTIDFAPSVSPGIIKNTTDFEASGTNGQVEEYIWNFGDNSPVERWYQVSHIYQNAGNYSISLTVVYADGTQRTTKKTYEVVRP
jgi:PKD repeat protein